MSVTVNLPDDLAGRLAAEAARRRVSIDHVAAELLAAQLGTEDPLEAFIGSGASRRGDLGRRHREIHAEVTEGRTPRDL